MPLTLPFVQATELILTAPESKLKQRTYNVAAISFTPAELAAVIAPYIPGGLSITCEPDFRQAIADSWPEIFDDSNLRKDLGWKHEYDIEKMTKDMITHLRPVYNK
jgi:threonine 3-dehydrogenase